MRADHLILPYIADSTPRFIDAWSSVRTLAFSMYHSDGGDVESDDDDIPAPKEIAGKIRLPPLSSKLGLGQSILDDSGDKYDVEEGSSKTKPKACKIVALGRIDPTPSVLSPKLPDVKKSAPSLSKSAGKASVKLPVDHEPFSSKVHAHWLQPVSNPIVFIPYYF